MSYIHIQVGRDKDSKVFDDKRFVQVDGDDASSLAYASGAAHASHWRRARHRKQDVPRASERRPAGAEINPLTLSPVGFSDKIAPIIERDGIQLYDQTDKRLVEKRSGRLL